MASQPKISGVIITSNTSIAGINVTSISAINGIATANIAGWPSGGGPSCTTVYYGYSDGGRTPPSDACFVDFVPYDYDSGTNTLYLEGQCGSTTAPVGFYSDGAQLYYFDGSTLNDSGPCRR